MTARRGAPIDTTEQTRALRIQALESYAILDTPPEEAFDDIAKIASIVCATPVALVSFVDSSRQWFKARIGLDTIQTPLDQSLCVHAVQRPGIFVVDDLRTDPRFADKHGLAWLGPLCFYAAAPIIMPDGFSLGTVCVLDDEPRRLSDDQEHALKALAHQVARLLEMRKASAIATKANQYRSRLMAVAGHDLKQPLQVINMILGSIQSTATPTVQSRLELALSSVRKLSTDLDRLALASRIGNESDAPKMLEFPLSLVLRTIEATWKEHAAQREVRLRIRDCSLHVWTDPAMLATILGNLVGNAIKYTPPGGTILVGCRRRGFGARVSVLDSGSGIPLERQKPIFDAFHQENPSSEGLGLGLSIVSRTAEVLGLRIEVTSIVGRGSVFSIDIPSAETAAGDVFDI